MLRYILLFLILAPAILAANDVSITLTNGSVYELKETLYTVLLVGEDVILLEKNGTRTIMHVDDCVTNIYTRSCLTSATETQAVFEETFIGAELKVKHELDAKTVDMGNEMEGVITLTNEGELPAKDVQVSFTLPEHVQLVTSNLDKQKFTWTGTVRDEVTIEYLVITTVNGSYSWNASGSYFDTNATQEFSTKNVTLASTLPFTYTIAYDKDTTSTLTQLNVTLKRKTVTDNYTFTITAIFPPEVYINSSTKNIQVDNATATYKKTPDENLSSLSVDVLYKFTAAPTTPLNVTIRYKNSTTDQTLYHLLPYTTFADSAPALAVGVDTIIAGEPGIITVTIPGNYTGLLTVKGPLLEESKEVESGTHAFTIAGDEPGNYTHTVSFTTITAYGTAYTASGSVDVSVEAPPPVIEEPVAEPANETVVPVVETPVEEPESHTLLYVAGAAAVVLLIILFLVVHSFSDPLRRLEKLTSKTTELRSALAKKRRQGRATERDEERLAELEAQLSELSRKL